MILAESARPLPGYVIGKDLFGRREFTMAGTVLTCSHEACGCTVEIVNPCGCSGAGSYRCHCGAELVQK